MGSSTTDRRDIYYRQSKADGYRARSAYKLLQLDEMYGFLGRRARHAAAAAWDFPSDGRVPVRKAHARALAPTQKSTAYQADEALPDSAPPRRAVDLCAAPGSWSQVLRAHLPPDAAIVSVDLQPMAPIPGVIEVLGDITSLETATTVVNALQHPELAIGTTPAVDPVVQGTDEDLPLADLVVCDGAPDVTGVHDLDEYLHAQLLLAAVQITFRVLASGGTFVAKVFTLPDESSDSLLSTATPRSGDQEGLPGTSGFLLKQQMLPWFEHVDIIKPRSSRPTSVEHFIVARGFRPPTCGPEQPSSAQVRNEVAEALRTYLDNHLGPAPARITGEPKVLPSYDTAIAITACGDLSAWDTSASAV